jgi:membrane protein YdbS with pleckstrin-like domain
MKTMRRHLTEVAYFLGMLALLLIAICLAAFVGVMLGLPKWPTMALMVVAVGVVVFVLDATDPYKREIKRIRAERELRD